MQVQGSRKRTDYCIIQLPPFSSFHPLTTTTAHSASPHHVFLFLPFEQPRWLDFHLSFFLFLLVYSVPALSFSLSEAHLYKLTDLNRINKERSYHNRCGKAVLCPPVYLLLRLANSGIYATFHSAEKATQNGRLILGLFLPPECDFVFFMPSCLFGFVLEKREVKKKDVKR